MEEQDRAIPMIFVTGLMQFLVGVLLMIALLNGQRDLTVLALLVLGMAFGAKLWTRVSLSGIQCHSRVDKRKVFPGETLTLKITAENKKFLPVWLQMKVPITGSVFPASGEKILMKEDSLLWYQSAHFEWELTAHRRGVHQIGPPHILAGDLFAFFSREKKAEEYHQIIVYPRIVPLKSFTLPRRDFFGVPGGKSPVKDPIYILGTRDYQSGQPAKYIHWKASARHHRLQEKVFEPAEQEKVLIVVDVSQFASHQAEEDFEHTLEIAASLAVRMDRQGYAVGLVTNGAIAGGGSAIVPIARNPQQLSAILEVLARLQMKSRGELLDVFRRGLELRWGVSCVHFSYAEDGTVAPAAEYFKHRKTPVIFFVCRPCFTGREEHLEGWRKIRCLDDISLREDEKA
ncbi:MAG: DUF58 domain-containing protein [Deltaproteobacteria bacterium]|nr:DUF58 domain-containing protein [Deltaproteobacteria bacterium]